MRLTSLFRPLFPSSLPSCSEPLKPNSPNTKVTKIWVVTAGPNQSATRSHGPCCTQGAAKHLHRAPPQCTWGRSSGTDGGTRADAGYSLRRGCPSWSGSPTRDLPAKSQALRPLSHKAGHGLFLVGRCVLETSVGHRANPAEHSTQRHPPYCPPMRCHGSCGRPCHGLCCDAGGLPEVRMDLRCGCLHVVLKNTVGFSKVVLTRR